MADIKEPPLDDATARLMEEHRQITEAITRLLEVRDLPDLLRRLDDLRALAVPHFAAEAAPGGFFDLLRARATRHFGRVADLEREHWTVVEQMEALAEEARACLAGPVAAILARGAALARHLEAHETSENALLMDALYTDIGDQ